MPRAIWELIDKREIASLHSQRPIESWSLREATSGATWQSRVLPQMRRPIPFSVSLMGYYVYILANSTNSVLYTGFIGDLLDRVEQYN